MSSFLIASSRPRDRFGNYRTKTEQLFRHAQWRRTDSSRTGFFSGNLTMRAGFPI